jgi:phosphonate transport system substrate-binding protein
VQFVGKEKYAEVNELLRKGDLDMAFVCSGPYVEGHDRFGLELLVAPQTHGETVYYSYIIVPRDSPARRFEDLRGKTFAFTDPDSNTGAIVPSYLLARANETPESFFKTYTFTYGHDKSIRAVAKALVDGAAVDSLIWDYLAAVEPGTTARTRIIWRSSPYGIPPVVVRPGLDAASKKRLQTVLLDVDKDPVGREILKGMMVDRFVPISDAAYGSVREMKNWIAAQKKKRGRRKP